MLAIAVLISGVGLYSMVKQTLVSQFDHALVTKVRTLTSFSEPGRVGINLAFTERPFPEFHGGPHAEYFQVWYNDGTSLAKSPSLERGNLPRRIHSADAPAFWSLRLPNGRPGRAVAMRLTSRTSERETFAIELVLARDTVELNRTLRGSALGIFGAGASLLVLASIGVKVATAKALQPVNTLAADVAAIDATSLKYRVAIESLPMDLRPIAEQINDLMLRLESAFHRERRFAANAAHELLTPVSELRLAAENAIDWPNDPRATASLATEARDLAGQMEHVVRSLLALSKAEARLMPHRVEPCDLSVLFSQVLGSLQESLAARSLQICFGPPCELEVMTDEVMLRSILNNLLLNAVEYSEPNSEIHISCREQPHSIEILIANKSATPLEPAHLEHFHEPFWRGDQAHQSREHAGLGLALSEAFAKVLDGELQLALEPANHVLARLTLPKRHGHSQLITARESAIAG
jgi:two-component system sensor histidine kinase QseC